MRTIGEAISFFLPIVFSFLKMRRERVYHVVIFSDLMSFSIPEAFQKRGFVMSTSSTAKTVTAHRDM